MCPQRHRFTYCYLFSVFFLLPEWLDMLKQVKTHLTTEELVMNGKNQHKIKNQLKYVHEVHVI